MDGTDLKGRDGGFYYGSWLKPRVFTLKCFLDNVPAWNITQIKGLFGRETEGDLVFSERPYAYYVVRPTKQIEMSLYRFEDAGKELYNGMVTITLTAHDPKAYMKYNSLAGFDEDGAAEETGILPKAMMPAEPELADRSFMLYNCGTERADTVINIAGTFADGLEIHNAANGTRCKIKDLSGLTPGSYLQIDSAKGQCRVIIGDEGV